MPAQLADYTADHRYLVEAAGRAAGLADPVAFDASFYSDYLLRKAVRGPLVPLEGALVRAWETGGRTTSAGTCFGIRLYSVNGIRFARVVATIDENATPGLSEFYVVSRKDYTRLFRVALRAMRERRRFRQASPPCRAW